MRVLLAIVMCAAPVSTAAQTAVTLPANDAALSLGWAGADHDVRAQRHWQGNLLVGFSSGHYWTDHLKTEVEASWNGSRNHQVYENIERQGGYTYAISDYRAADVRGG